MISKHGSEDILLIFDTIIHNTFTAHKRNNFRMTAKDFRYMDVNTELSKRDHTVHTALGLTR
jgi:hypothetical protein